LNPKRIAAYLRRAWPDLPIRHICDQMIHQGFYHGGKGGLSRQLAHRLRTGWPYKIWSQPMNCRGGQLWPLDS
jgi:hypothetical protein